MPDPAASPVFASPLAGKRVVITRAVAQSSALFERLLQRRAIPLSLPLVSFSGPQDYAPLDAALRRWREFDWIVFTSANAVQSVVARSAASNFSIRQVDGRPRIAVVGPATKYEAVRTHLSVDHIARTHLGMALAEELAPELTGREVFLPRSDRANPDLPVALKRLGAKLTEVIAYRTLPPNNVDRNRVTEILGTQADAALFFSPSAVHNLTRLIGEQSLLDLQNTMAFAAVGPTTAAALREYGLARIIMAEETSAEALIAALEGHFSAAVSAGAGPQPIAGAKHG